MKVKLLHTLFPIFLLFHIALRAQEETSSRNMEAIIESIAENLEEETDASIIVEDLEKLAESPLNINSASAVELSQLHILNDIQIQKLMDYRNIYGAIYSLYEINIIDGFTPDLLSKMEPFIWFGPEEKEQMPLSETVKYGRHQLLLRSQSTIQQPKGYKPKDDGTIPYEGNRARYYTRYRFKAGDLISTGITAEKDPGEAFFSGSNKRGFDFYSAHFSMKINDIVQNVTLGDFVIRSGQGVVLWQGFSTGKSVYTLDIQKTNQGIRPFTSTDENQFFRGIATTLKFGDGKLDLFYSRKKSDANLDFSDSNENYFTSLQTSGYHRTENEILDKNSVMQTNAGAVATWSFSNINIGATIIKQNFEIPFIRSDQLYNKFRFSGKENLTGGINYLYSKGKYQIFGEAATSKSKGKAFLQGVIIHINDQVGISGLLRHFDKNYHALWANAFTEGSSAENESGLYLGTRILPVKFVTLHAYTDFYRSRWISYSTAGPSEGQDIFVQADFVFSPRIKFYIRHKNETKDQKMTLDERYVNEPETTKKNRFHFQYKPSEKVTLKTRFEHSFFRQSQKENGFMIFQDVQFSPLKTPINFATRLAWFTTPSYNTRIYAYENDILYTFSIPAYYGKGFRMYLNLKYEVSDKIDAWLKIGNTLWTDRETISSGNNEIRGNQKTEVKIQLRLKI